MDQPAPATVAASQTDRRATGTWGPDPVRSDHPAKLLTNVQALRAIAAYLVVSVHARKILDSDAALSLFGIGFAGVDLFFVISGFIMAYTTDRARVSGSTFFLQRICRIVPLYYLFTFLVFALALMAPRLLNSTTPDMGQLIRSLLFVPFEKSAGRIYPVYFLGWTLNYEMFFYALFAGAMLVRPRARVAVVALILLVLAASPRLLGLEGAAFVPVYFYTQPIVLDFAMGMLVARYRKEIAAMAVRWPHLPLIQIGLGVAGLLAAPLLPQPQSSFVPSTNTFLVFGLPATLVLMGAVGLELSGRRIQGRLLPRLGDASYSIYLAHPLLIDAFAAAANRLNAGPAVRWPLMLLALAVVTWASILLYRHVERPLCQALRRLLLANSARESPSLSRLHHLLQSNSRRGLGVSSSTTRKSTMNASLNG